MAGVCEIEPTPDATNVQRLVLKTRRHQHTHLLPNSTRKPIIAVFLLLASHWWPQAAPFSINLHRIKFTKGAAVHVSWTFTCIQYPVVPPPFLVILSLSISSKRAIAYFRLVPRRSGGSQGLCCLLLICLWRYPPHFQKTCQEYRNHSMPFYFIGFYQHIQDFFHLINLPV